MRIVSDTLSPFAAELEAAKETKNTTPKIEHCSFKT